MFFLPPLLFSQRGGVLLLHTNAVCTCVTMLAEGRVRRVNGIMKHKGHKGAICDCMREVHHQLVELDCVKFFFFLLKLFLFHLSVYSSINVSCPLPLVVRLSSVNKQTRSSCQLCPTPTPDPTNRNLSLWHSKYATF